MSDKLRVLVISHAHPSISLGGGEIASYNLHKGLNALPDVQSVYLARAAHPIPRHGTTALMSMRRASDEILFHADEYDHFYLSNKNTDEIRRDLLRFVRDFDPDIVHFHHVLGLGLETLYAIREALPDRIILVTFHEFLSICNNDGQMVKAGTSKLCNEASPSIATPVFRKFRQRVSLSENVWYAACWNWPTHSSRRASSLPIAISNGA